jgi:hypothetical protein
MEDTPYGTNGTDATDGRGGILKKTKGDPLGGSPFALTE